MSVIPETVQQTDKRQRQNQVSVQTRRLRCKCESFSGQRPEVRDQKPEVRDQKPEIRNQRPETRDQRLETRNHRPETRGQRSEVRDLRPEVRVMIWTYQSTGCSAEDSSSSWRSSFAHRSRVEPRDHILASYPDNLQTTSTQTLYCSKSIRIHRNILSIQKVLHSTFYSSSKQQKRKILKVLIYCIIYCVTRILLLILQSIIIFYY